MQAHDEFDVSPTSGVLRPRESVNVSVGFTAIVEKVIEKATLYVEISDNEVPVAPGGGKLTSSEDEWECKGGAAGKEDDDWDADSDSEEKDKAASASPKAAATGKLTESDNIQAESSDNILQVSDESEKQPTSKVLEEAAKGSV